jgi:dihydrofolate reductase
MTKVVIDMSMSLDGFVAGPDDSREHPLGRHGGSHIFDWYFSSDEPFRDPQEDGPNPTGVVFRPEPGANRDQVRHMFEQSGAYIFGRRTYEITDGWGGRHPVNGAPTFVLTSHPPADYPRGPSNLTFVTDGIESAIRQARKVAGGKDIKLGGASPGQQALAAGVCDEILIHVAPYLLGDGVRLFDRLPTGIRLEKLSVSDGSFATHLRYQVNYEPVS